MKVYLVEDHGNSPGRIYAVFHDKKDAQWFARQLNREDPDTQARVEPRTLIWGQPPILGYNE